MTPITMTLSDGLPAGLAACNTVEGAGQEVAAGGDATGDTARAVAQDISDRDPCIPGSDNG